MLPKICYNFVALILAKIYYCLNFLISYFDELQYHDSLSVLIVINFCFWTLKTFQSNPGIYQYLKLRM